MDDLQGDRQVQAQCRDIIRQYEPLFNAIVEQQTKELNSGGIQGDTSFKMAKEVIRREGMIEGMRKVMQVIHRYAKES